MIIKLKHVTEEELEDYVFSNSNEVEFYDNDDIEYYNGLNDYTELNDEIECELPDDDEVINDFESQFKIRRIEKVKDELMVVYINDVYNTEPFCESNNDNFYSYQPRVVIRNGMCFIKIYNDDEVDIKLMKRV